MQQKQNIDKLAITRAPVLSCLCSITEL